MSNLTNNKKFWKTIRPLKKRLMFLTLSSRILHLTLRYHAANHYLKIETFQKLWKMKLKTLKIIVVYLQLKTIEIQTISFRLNLSQRKSWRKKSAT